MIGNLIISAREEPIVKKFIVVLSIFGMMLGSACGGTKQLKSTPTIEASATFTSIPATETPIPTETTIPTETPIPTLTPTPLPYVENYVNGIDLGPYLTGDPNSGDDISESELRDLIERVAPYTIWIRTYGTENGLEYAGAIAGEFGLPFAATAWLSSDLEANRKQMESLIEMAKNDEVNLAIIGNETLLRGDLTVRELMIYIDWFKEEVPGVPVTTTDVWSELKQYPELIESIDMVAVNVYPYWDNVKLENSISSIQAWYEDAKATVESISPEKEIIIAETGWPSCGENGDPTSQQYYLANLNAFAEEMDINYFWFEAYDEPWKAEYEGEAGACWGLWDNEEQLKPEIEKFFSGDIDASIIKSAGDPSLELTYIPLMGDTDDLEGMVHFVNPDEYQVAVYIYVPDAGGWWTKPFYDYPLTEIDEGGYWACPIITGGIDEQATRIAVFLIPEGYTPPLANGMSSLPQSLYNASVSEVEVSR
jgi:exo-beta-1,3-glucanase (GH17 family)